MSTKELIVELTSYANDRTLPERMRDVCRDAAKRLGRPHVRVRPPKPPQCPQCGSSLPGIIEINEEQYFCNDAYHCGGAR